MSNKPLTCATILLSHDKKDILIGKITLQNKYDLPKGKLEENETEIEAASRELQEETGLSVSVDNYKSYSQYALYNMFFNKEKNISLFFLYDKDNQLISNENMANLKCHSDFEYKKKCIQKLNHLRKLISMKPLTTWNMLKPFLTNLWQKFYVPKYSKKDYQNLLMN